MKEKLVFRKSCGEKTSPHKLQASELKTVTYGTALASFLAVSYLQELAYKSKEWYPEASEVIINDLLTDSAVQFSLFYYYYTINTVR